MVDYLPNAVPWRFALGAQSLVKSTPGVYFPKAQKDTDDLTVFFVLLGSACVKATHKHVGEISSWTLKCAEIGLLTNIWSISNDVTKF